MVLIFHTKSLTAAGYHIVTAADKEYYSRLTNFIGSLHVLHFDDIAEISVFDLGLDSDNKQALSMMQKVKVYQIEQTNPDILKQFVVRDGNKIARGWYSWKPVVIKQALDMFDTIFYIDAGAVVLTPLHNIFKYIEKHGYFFVDCPHSMAWMTTRRVIDAFDLDSQGNRWMLSPWVYGISAGIQGLNHKYYGSYVMHTIFSKKGLCFYDSVVVNIPTNRVQNVSPNSHMNAWSPEQLLIMFNDGLRIDISLLYGMKNNSTHMDYALHFLKTV